MSNVPTPASADAAVLARLPLQIGTTSAWSAGRAAAALFPGFALIGVAIAMIAHFQSNGSLVIAIAVGGGMLVFYAVTHAFAAVRTRASDVMLFPGGLTVDGGH